MNDKLTATLIAAVEAFPHFLRAFERIPSAQREEFIGDIQQGAKVILNAASGSEDDGE